ncbi:MAG: hypothetical protein U5R06_10335 [candidate division KSB1 bacterium]|nr:hypothetical protein [candidate division KSB1 bacterium]
MKRYLEVLCVVVLALGVVAGVQAQTATHDLSITVNGFQLIGLEGGGRPVAFEVGAPASAGEKPVIVSSSGVSDNYLLYSSIFSTTDNKITAALDADVESPLTLSVSAAAATGGGGDKGDVQTGVVLSSAAADVITGIGSCWTGLGTNGAQLTYSLAIPDDVTDLDDVNDQPLTVTYTITNTN